MIAPWSRTRFQCTSCGYALLRVGELKRMRWRWLNSPGLYVRNKFVRRCADENACWRRSRDKVSGSRRFPLSLLEAWRNPDPISPGEALKAMREAYDQVKGSE